jgi:hypothetical protein
MKGEGGDDRAAKAGGRLRRWGGYALGIVIESAAVGAIALAALGVMFIVKALVT